MKLNYLAVNTLAQTQVPDGIDRPCVLGAAAALAVGRCVALPTSEVDDMEAFYADTVLPQVKLALSEINDALVMDVARALEWTRMHWMIRYVGANPCSKPNLNPIYGFFDTIVGVGNFVDQESHEFMNKHKIAILLLADEIQRVRAELQATEENKGV